MRSSAKAISERPLILADRSCPFTHRVLALLAHLDVSHDLREAAAGAIPQGLQRWSPSGRIPLLVHGDIVIGESRVMLEYVAEAYAFATPYPGGLVESTLQRHAMAVMDTTVAPLLFPTLQENTLDPSRLSECIDVLEQAVLTSPPPNLLAFHLAPIWLRFQWWHPDSAVTRLVRARPALAGWLDEAVHLPSVVSTSPKRSDSVADYHDVCANLGLAKR